MKKLLIVGIAALSLAFITPASAFLDDNSIDNSTNAAATVDNVSAGSSSGGNNLEGGNLTVEDNRVYEASDNDYTGPAPAGEINYPIGPNFFGGATPSYMDRLKVKDILEYDEDQMTLNVALQMRQDDAFMGKRIMVREKYGKMIKKSRIPADHPMKVFYTKQADMQSLGTITVVSDSKKSVSPDVFAEIVVKAHELGAVALHVKAEGFQRQVRNEGAGLGFSWSGSAMDQAGTVSAQTGVMGFGKSWGEAGYYDHPFIIVHVLFPKGYSIGDARSASGNIADWLKD